MLQLVKERLAFILELLKNVNLEKISSLRRPARLERLSFLLVQREQEFQ